MNHPKNTLLRASELGDALGVAGSTVRDWTRAGVIKPTYITPGGHYRFDLESVRAQLAAAHAAPHDSPTSHHDEGGA